MSSKDMTSTQYAVDLILQGYSATEVQQIMKQRGVNFPTIADTLNELLGKKDLTVEIVAGLAEIDPATITPDASLKDTLGLDSLDFVDVVVLVEQHFGVTLTGPDFVGIVTFKDFYDLLNRKINGE